MATKTFEELKQLAIQIRDEKTNKQNTATRVGTAMLEHINKLEQDYYDKTTINNRTSEYNVSINHPTSGISSSNKYDLSSAIAQVPAELRTDGLTVSFLNSDGNTEKWEFGGGSWTVGSFSQVGAEKLIQLNTDLSNISGISINSVSSNPSTQLDVLSNLFSLKDGDTIRINISLTTAFSSNVYLRIYKDGKQKVNLGTLAKDQTEYELEYTATEDLENVYLIVSRYVKEESIYHIKLEYPTDITRMLDNLSSSVFGTSEQLPAISSDYTTIEPDGTLSNRVGWTRVCSFDVQQGFVYRYSIRGDTSIKKEAMMALYKDENLVMVAKLSDGSLQYEGLLSVNVDANKLYVQYNPGYPAKYPNIYKVLKYSLADEIQLLKERLNTKLDADSDLLKSDWEGKVIGFYGDSVTEFYAKGNYANGTYPFYDETTTINPWGVDWCTLVAKYFRCKQIRVRGIGAQKYAWGNTGGWTCFINNETGLQKTATYAEYPNKAEECPEGHTVTRGCACSWLRIINQFPEAIKDTIDAVLIMFHNDVGLDDSVKEEEFQFVPEDRTDEEWASSEYYSKYNGDFNIKTVRGGIASTIMKFQAWMPNARLILCTPMSTAVDTNTIGDDKTALTTDLSYTLKMYKVAQAVKDVADKLSIPLIDVFHNDGINPLNRTPYVSDMIHPGTKSGNQRLAITMIGGMKTILPNPEK